MVADLVFGNDCKSIECAYDLTGAVHDWTGEPLDDSGLFPLLEFYLDGLRVHAQKHHVDHALGVVAEDALSEDIRHGAVNGLVLGKIEKCLAGSIPLDHMALVVNGEAWQRYFVESGAKSFEGSPLD